ncbi:hypothetical protein [Phocoenobacter atlanticus]|uniref:hypothetical protein n=1 Tax=Phocoenobacter atlanticus TaxID=3416742 RepID=UPI00274A1A24|nr:hypothetical protein [Pasteurella atlantica]MDP8100374.1 hypothetical protein [Pasteurella atlantica]
MMNQDINFIVYDYQSLVNANASKEYQKYIHRMTDILVSFLSENKLLINIEPYDSGKVRQDLVIYSSNLTKDGFELFKKPVRNWWKAHDRGTSVEKITILEKGLARILSRNDK